MPDLLDPSCLGCQAEGVAILDFALYGRSKEAKPKSASTNSCCLQVTDVQSTQFQWPKHMVKPVRGGSMCPRDYKAVYTGSCQSMNC